MIESSWTARLPRRGDVTSTQFAISACAFRVRCETVSSTAPAWRNWQTRWTQNPVIARSCGFDPLRRHSPRRCSDSRALVRSDALVLLVLDVLRAVAALGLRFLRLGRIRFRPVRREVASEFL